VTFEDARILVVEDEPGVLRAVQRILGARHQVTPAQKVAEALEQLRLQSFDIAIVDLQLPDGDGYQLNREIHRLGLDTDVILMTGSTTHQDRKLFQALEADAFYFLFKPFDRRVLLALVDRCLRLRDLRRKNEAHLARLARDQEKAREIQRSLLPATPLEAHGWYVTARFEPADEVSGDLYAVLPLREGQDPARGRSGDDGLAVLVADVVGHGLPAAMYAGMLRSTVDAARRLDPDPAVVFEQLFEGLDFFASNRGASLFYGVLGVDGRLRYFNAGHPPALLCRADGELEHLESTGPKLLPSPIVRAKDPANRELGLAGVESLVAEGDGTAEEAMESVLTTFERHCDGRPVEDDVTALLVERVG